MPEPVDPVQSTSPRGRLQIHSQVARGSPSVSKSKTSNGITRSTAATTPRCMKALVRNLPRLATPKEKSISRFFSNFAI